MTDERNGPQALLRLASKEHLDPEDYERLAMAVFGGLLAKDAERADRFKRDNHGAIAAFMYMVAPPAAPKINFIDPCWKRLSQDLYSGEPGAFMGVQRALAYAKTHKISAHPRWGGERKRVVERLFAEAGVDPYAPEGMRYNPATVAQRPEPEPRTPFIRPDVYNNTMKPLRIHVQLGIADAWLATTDAEREAFNAQLATLSQAQRVERLKALAGELMYERVNNRDLPPTDAEWLRALPPQLAREVDRLPPRSREILSARFQYAGTRGDHVRLMTELNNMVVVSRDRVTGEELLRVLIRGLCPSKDSDGAVYGYEIRLEQGELGFSTFLHLRGQHVPKLEAAQRRMEQRHERERQAEHQARQSGPRADHQMTESHDRLYAQAYLRDPAVVAAVAASGGTLQTHDGGRSFLVYDEYSMLIERMPPGVTPEAFLIEFGTHLNRTVNDGGFSTVNVFKRRNNGPLKVGEIVDINMFGPDNGTVILSKLESNYFIYTVLENDTYGGEHPEYGSREFGFERQHDGTIKIYTRAVSSPADILADKIGKHFQEGGWTFMIRGMARTITRRGGRAVPNSFKTTKWSREK